MQLIQRLDRVAEALREFCDRRKLLLLCSFSVLYLLGTCLLASQKPMWSDEFFTFYISRLARISDIWSALLTGGEQIPPFFHLVTRVSLTVFGVNHLSIRLPEVLGFWLMSLCLFWFVSKRSSTVYGFAAMLFPLVTKAYYYAYEARPYGIVLGFAGLALVCWQSAGEANRRQLPLIGLALSLAAAVSSHYYAVFLFVPLFVGEAARSISLRRVDPPVWAAFGFGMIPLLLFLPLIGRAKAVSAIFWAQPRWRWILDFYYSLLTPALLPLILLFVVAAVYSTTDSTDRRSQDQERLCAPALHEIAAALGFIMIPVVAGVVAIFVTGGMTGRYVLPSVIGFSVLIAFAAYRLLDGRAIMGVSLVIFLFAGFLMAEVRSFRSLVASSLGETETIEFLRFNNKNELPIVASDLHTFMTLAHYAPRDIASRVVYLADPQASLRYLGHSSVDQGILDLKPWFGLRIEEYRPYVASQQQFLVYGSIGWLNWLVAELTATNRRIELKGRNGENLLFLVSTR